jgi:hypothetical protein
MGVNNTKFYSCTFLSCRNIITEFTCAQVCGVKLRGFIWATAILVIVNASEAFNFTACHIYIFCHRTTLASIVEMCVVKFSSYKVSLKNIFNSQQSSCCIQGFGMEIWGKEPIGRSRCRRKDTIKTDAQELGFKNYILGDNLNIVNFKRSTCVDIKFLIMV